MEKCFRVVSSGGSAPVLIEKEITANGTYLAEDDSADGYSSVRVDVQPVTQEKSATPSTSQQEITPDAGKVLSKVTVGAVTAAIDENIKAGNIKSGVAILGVTGSYAGSSKLPQVVDRSVTVIAADDLAGITSIGEYAFYDCTGLTSVTIPGSVTRIKSYAFNGCSGLTLIAVPDSVTNIASYAFYYCTGLTSLTIGNGVTSIGSSAFYNCSGLTSVTIEAEVPPTLANANAFGNTNSCPIYVPAASVAAYQSATNWSALASRIQAIPS